MKKSETITKVIADSSAKNLSAIAILTVYFGYLKEHMGKPINLSTIAASTQMMGDILDLFEE